MTRRIASAAAAAVAVLFVFATLAAACGGSYCDHYSDWRQAERDANRAEAAENIGDLRDAMDRRSSAANKMWDAAPAGYTWSDIRRAC